MLFFPEIFKVLRGVERANPDDIKAVRSSSYPPPVYLCRGKVRQFMVCALERRPYYSLSPIPNYHGVLLKG